MGISISNQLLGSTGLSVGLGLSRGNGLSFGGFAGGPALYLPFALTGTLDPRVTFSRPSLATMYDSTGKLVYAPNQLFLQSADFSTASWLKVNCSVSGSGNVTLGAGTLAKNIGQTVAANVANNVVSFDVLAGTHSTFQIIDTGDAEAYANFNAATGAVGTKGTRTLSGVTSLGGGAYRLWAVFTAGALSRTVRIYAVDSTSAAYGATTSSTGNFTLLGSASSAVTYETAPRSQDQVITTAAAYYGPRFDYNPATLVARGLLIEEARTNLLLRSADATVSPWSFDASTGSGITLTGGLAPDGVTQFAVFNEGTSTSAHRVNQGVSSVAGTTYTISAYVKAGTSRYILLGTTSGGISIDTENWVITETIAGANTTTTNGALTSVGNGVYRATVSVAHTTDTTIFFVVSTSVSATPGTMTPSFAGTSRTAIFTFCQTEASSFATSYIPTAASTVARSADSATMTGTNFSSWYNQTQGTFVVGADTIISSGNGDLIMAGTSGGFNPGSVGSFGGSAAISAYTRASSAYTANLSITGSPGVNTAFKVAIAYKTDDVAGVTNGGAVATATPPNAMPTTVNDLTIMGSALTGSKWNGHIASLAYYNTRLPNATLQSLTLPVIADYYFLVTAGGDQITDASGNPLYTQPLYL